VTDHQLGFFGEATPLDQLGSREVRAGQRGGSTKAAAIPDQPEKYVQILAVLGRHSHADFELQRELPTVHPGTVSKRRLRLEQAHLVEEVPNVMRRTPHGVEAMTFRITDKGKEVLRQWRQQHPDTSSGKSHPTRASDPTSPSSTSYELPPVSGPSSVEGFDTPGESSTT
jgi:hypothetical protein